MTSLIVESVWLNDAHLCSLEELAEFSGLTDEELAELVKVGAIEPDDPASTVYLFRSKTIVVARAARRLRDDFELDTHGLAVALNLMQRIHLLEAKLAAMDAKLPRSF